MKIVYEQIIGGFQTKDMQTRSVLIRFSWMMRNVLKRMKNKFSDFYFSSYHETLIENWADDAIIMTIIRKKKSEKSEI